ncbi:MAG: 3-phenylpropionate/cinnamic acid dioxygenase subunit beta [Actinomycetota bacterium]|nr:3-phenylpropionate/cinnamic acid dioxygenase subunit beta [Actinomycetota bacterium]
MPTADTPYKEATGRRVRASEPLHGDIVEHLEDEAQLLDEDDLMGWIQLLAEDLVYRAPIRCFTERGSGSPFDEEAAHFEENAMTIFLKVMRLTQTSSAWAENPASRTRRIVSNVRVHETDVDGEYRVDSSILLLRSRYDDTHYDLLSGRRVDCLRRADSGFRLASRTIYFDQTALGVSNLAVYL